MIDEHLICEWRWESNEQAMLDVVMDQISCTWVEML